MTVVRNSVVLLFILVTGLSFSLPQADASCSPCSRLHRDSEGLKLTRKFIRTFEGHEHSDGTGIHMRAEVTAKITNQRTSSGPVAIVQTDPEGRFVMLENDLNTGVRQAVDLTNWTLQRQLDNQKIITYKFGHSNIKPGKTLKIWARGYSSEANIHDLVFRDEENWGTGLQVATTLADDKNEEKATLIQKTL